jgi:hypothetical protein
MATQSNTWENVKLPKELVDRMRKNKEKTFVPITTFATISIEKELKRIEKQKKK